MKLSVAQIFSPMTGKWRSLTAFFFGALASLAFAPFFAFPLWILAFGWLWKQWPHCQNAKQAFFLGWWFGFGHFIAGLYWITIAFFVDPDKFGWMAPLGVPALSVYFALYPALVCLLIWKLQRKDSLGAFYFALLWFVSEIARGYLLTGFPWNNAGTVFAIHPVMLQTAALWGEGGLSLLAVWLAILPFASNIHLSARRGMINGSVVLLVLAGMAGYGTYRLANASVNDVQEADSQPLLRIVQANIPQSLKWDPVAKSQAVRKHLEMSFLPDEDGKIPDYVFWSETSFPYPLDKNNLASQQLAQMIPPGSTLVTGALRTEGQGNNWQVWNSMSVVDSTGITAHFDKQHLVPFGEYVPLRHVLPIEKITPGGRDFSRGNQSRLLQIGNLAKAIPLICYEVIFSRYSLQKEGEWLLNITNDGWYGISSGPFQHFHMAQLRAIESGKPMIRIANTGISAVIDAYGKILNRLNLAQEGVINFHLPQKINQATLYSRLSILSPLLIIIILLLMSVTIARISKIFEK
jgi:apolipoprotein N-acyltransferase